MGRPRCVRATCDLRLEPPAQSNLHGAANAGCLRHMLRALLGSDRKNKKDGPRSKFRQETPSCSGAGARRTRIEVAYLTGSELEQSKGVERVGQIFRALLAILGRAFTICFCEVDILEGVFERSASDFMEAVLFRRIGLIHERGANPFGRNDRARRTA